MARRGLAATAGWLTGALALVTTGTVALLDPRGVTHRPGTVVETPASMARGEVPAVITLLSGAGLW